MDQTKDHQLLKNTIYKDIYRLFRDFLSGLAHSSRGWVSNTTQNQEFQ